MAAAAAANPPRSSSGSVDSYVGSLISLTSKSEIRYEGVLFDINTEESSIGLRNVRSFGTEGQKNDGLQFPPSEKVYEYIKDLQVQSSPPIQTMPIHHDPAIILSHYPQAPTASMSLPPFGPSTIPDPSAHTAQMSLLAPAFQGSLPLYQPSVNLGSWGSSPPPPTTNVSGLAVPMYWQGYYGSPGFQAQQQSLLRPPPGLSMPPAVQQTMQYPAMTASLPSGSSNLPASPLLESPSPLLPPFSLGTRNLQSSILPAQSSAIVSESSTTLITDNASTRSLSTVTLSNSLPLVSPLSSGLDKTAISSSVSDKPKVHGPAMPFTSMSESTTSIAGTSSSTLKEGATPSLVTPGQLLQLVPTTVSPSQPSQTVQRGVQVVQVSSSEISLSTAATEAQEPILPLPSPSNYKPCGAPTHQHSNRGRERGRGNGISHPVTRFRGGV